MSQTEKRRFLIRRLLDEQPRYRNMEIPSDVAEQSHLLRSLFNIRMPGAIDEGFLNVQDEYLQEETKRKGVTRFADLTPVRPGLYLWQGDITTLACDAIVNAANSGMTGCYQPCHNCIDNCIHTYAGIQLRNACAEIMKKQGFEEPTGQAKITSAYNLPCNYVIHTVGPIVQGSLTNKHKNCLLHATDPAWSLPKKTDAEALRFAVSPPASSAFHRNRRLRSQCRQYVITGQKQTAISR